uniref:Uncharacterized protein n=1 Tax=Oryza brachyantha TaxID=4533 RepID=J3N9S8_ORYBR
MLIQLRRVCKNLCFNKVTYLYTMINLYGAYIFLRELIWAEKSPSVNTHYSRASYVKSNLQ